MSLLLSRNVLIPIWFVGFSLFAVFARPLTFWPSVLLLVIGLVVPAIAYAICKEAPMRVKLVSDSDVEQSETRIHVLSRLS